MTIVPAARSPIDPRLMARAIAREFEAQGSPLPLPAVELFTVLTWIETGGHATDNNVGNESAAGFNKSGAEFSTWNGDAWRPPWFAEPTAATPAATVHLHERMKGYTSADGKYHAPDVPSAFRSYPTLAAGMRDHVAMILRNFKGLLAAAKTGDADRFRMAIAAPDPTTKYSYSVDYSPAHTKTIVSLRDQFRAARVFDGIAVSSPGAWAAVAVAVAAVVAWKAFGK